jgi:Putative Flp pilus-assembly TadE/G-like
MPSDLHPAFLHAPDSEESGQAAVSLLLMLSLFLLGTLALAVDFTNIWFHRQAEQATADSACQAGAMDLLAVAGGMSLPAMGFTSGTASNCVSNSGSTMCTYANANGYSGTGLTAGAASNAVSWTFPPSVTGVTAPAASVAPHPFLTITIAENVRTFFVSLLKLSKVQQINVSSTCGLVGVKAAAPMLILHPTMSGSLSYSGGASVTIVGGPSRGLQVNSSSATAVDWTASGIINLSAGGANQTGSDMAIVGGPSAIPNNGSSYAYNGGSTGSWKSSVLPIADPFGSVGPPVSIKSITPANTTGGTWVTYGTDACPDNTNAHYPTTHDCIEYSPGYYPSGIVLPDDYSTAIFLPGIYYLNGSLNASGSNLLRMAKPSGSLQTDGIMLYFLTGSLNLSGCAGCAKTSVDNVNSTDLSCDGSAPTAGLGAPTTLSGNVLVAQCAASGTYWDAGTDTADSRGNPGVRGLLIFQDHGDTTAPQFAASGSLTTSGALYFHSTSYQDVLTLSGASTSGSYFLGQIIVDQLNMSGSGLIKLALNPVPATSVLKAALLQ